MKIGSSGEQLVPPLDKQAWDALGLDTGWIGPLVAAIDEQTAVVREVFLTGKQGKRGKA
jgi:hypothetical protein